jgi:anti-sigma factor RsiW
MITCRELTELLMEFVSGELPPERHEHIEKHLHLCSPCMILVETYRYTITLSRNLPRQPLPPACEQRLRAAVKKNCSEGLA